MSPRHAGRMPISSIADLLQALRAVRLLSPREWRRLAATWSDDDDPGARWRELVNSGLLTPFQSQMVLRGRARRLRLGQYVLLERLGTGGMGCVYKAEHRLMKRVVALKLMSRRREVGPTGAAFRREVEAAARLRHPHIVLAHDAAEARGRRFLVMEYVEGMNLEQLVRQAGPLPVPLVREALRQTALALDYALPNGVFHNDVKPANLMLSLPGHTADRQSLRVITAPLFKLLDLGLARAAAE